MARHSVLQTFYASDLWRDFRMGLILERGPYCQKCSALIANTKKLIGHHEIELTPENVHDHMISLNPQRVRLVCHDCHNKMHNRFGARRERCVYVVYGPPLAGKKTFVQEQMMRGDLVVDMDRLFEAVSFQPAYDKPDNLLGNVMGLQLLLLDNIKTRAGKWGNAWVIGGYPDRFKRERIATELGAELVFVETPKELCFARLDMDPLRSSCALEWQKYIDKWFESYQK